MSCLSCKFRRKAAQAALIVAATVVTLASLTAYSWAGSITQFFPAVPEGQSAQQAQSGWRISWRVRQDGTHTYGSSDVWEFNKIEFMKGQQSDGTEDWITVLNKLAMAEMYVPYNNGLFFEDMQMGFGLTEAQTGYLPRYGFVRAQIESEGAGEKKYIVSEVIDDGVRWMDNYEESFAVRRGQALRLWATLVAGNYSYVMIYTFADDGRISVRVGGTAQNLENLDSADMTGSVNFATHGHMGAWRMEFDLGDVTANKIEVIERIINQNTNEPGVSLRPFNGNQEGGEAWEPDKFTLVKIRNTQTRNRHSPAQHVSYVLKTWMNGRLRTDMPYTERDFWVSRLVPDGQNRIAPELKFVDVPDNVKNGETLTDKAVVLWHNAALQHIPRGEDFGPVEYLADDGAAINSYTGFDLVPVHLWHKTPFLDRGTAGRDGKSEVTAILRRGDTGDQVRALQRLLDSRGYSLAVDGNFGRSTESVVRSFQSDNNLTVDGVVGQMTLEKLQG